MADEEIDKEPRKPLPRWLVLGVIVVTGALTATAMSVTGLRGPAVAWDRANKTVESVWAGELGGTDDPRRFAAMSGPPGAAQPAAALPGVPLIVAGAPLIHADRGACTNCHGVLTQQGTAVPAINALSSMTHEYRGVCTNCHQLKVSAAGISPVAATPYPRPVQPVQPAIGIGGGALGGGALAPRATRQPTEAEWQGLEVGPSPQGVLVAGAEGAAKTAGVRAGDLVTSINATPVRTMDDFVRATDGGALRQGAVIVRRDGQRLAFELGAALRNAPPPPIAAPWGAPAAPIAPEAQF